MSSSNDRFDLGAWLQSLGMAQYTASFEQNGISREVLTSLNDNDLREIGVAALGHRKAILLGIETLRQENQFEAAALKSETPVPIPDTGIPPSDGLGLVVEPVITEPPAKRSARFFWKNMGASSLAVSIAAHVLFVIIATYFVVQTFQASRKVTFQAGSQSPNPSQRALEHKVSLAKKQNAMSAPAQPKRITTTGAAKVALPDMPALPNPEPFTPGTMAGMGGVGFGTGFGGGGTGKGGAGGGAVPAFGFREQGKGGFLVGTFYDLKQDAQGNPTDMNEERYGWALQGFVKNGWKEKDLDGFYKAPQKLFAPQIFIPALDANAAPQSFGVADKVQPRLWCIVYRGKVSPNEGGTYRFAGFGDDVLVVRWRNKVVLDCGFINVSGVQPEGYVRSEGLSLGGSLPPSYKGLGIGTTFRAEPNNSYDVEILVGEQPGGQFKAYVMLMKVGAEYAKDAGGSPILPIFKLAPSPPPQVSSEAPVFAPDGPIWRGAEDKPSPFGLPR